MGTGMDRLTDEELLHFATEEPETRPLTWALVARLAEECRNHRDTLRAIVRDLNQERDRDESELGEGGVYIGVCQLIWKARLYGNALRWIASIAEADGSDNMQPVTWTCAQALGPMRTMDPARMPDP